MGYRLCTTKESMATLACLFRTSGQFLMLQLIIADSRHFTQPELSVQWSDLIHEIKSVSFCICSLEYIKVTQMGHFENLALIYAFITIGHQARS